MKKIILSTVAITTLALTGASADTSSDIAEMKAMMKQMTQRLTKLEAENSALKATQKKQAKVVKTVQAKQVSGKKIIPVATIEKKDTPVFAKASKLKFSGTHYLGFVNGHNKNTVTGETSTYNDFETRRNYIQVKAYLFDDPKSYMRVTLDTHQVKDNSTTSNSGDWEVRLKYAYLYLNDVLPFTGVEFGQAHRPWIDYEEHHGWLYRSIAKTFVEKKQDADFTNSADLGFNFKTKLDYFSSELGLFNGEGYHGILDKDGKNGLSFEWRLTANLLGTGKKHVHKHDTYADVSFYGQYNNDYSKKGDAVTGDFIWYGINAVYNQPEFLIAANYLNATEAGADFKGSGYSINGELRLETFAESLKKWNIIGRYDNWDLDAFSKSRENTIAGITYKYNKNVEFIANYLGEKDPRNDIETDKYMFTAEVKW